MQAYPHPNSVRLSASSGIGMSSRAFVETIEYKPPC